MQSPTQVRERIEPVGAASDVTRAPAWLIAITVVLAVALVALGAWVIVDRTGDETPPAEEVTPIVQRSIDAWDTGDSAAIVDLYAQDATFEVGADLTSAQEIADYVDELDGMGFMVTQLSSTVVVGNTEITVVAYGAAGDLATNLSVIEVNGDGLIVSQTGQDVTGVEVTQG